MHINDFNYELPEELIAQVPVAKRDESRLMVIDRSTGAIESKTFFDIVDYLEEGDCLVMNNSKVIPARIYGYKEETGAQVEFLLTKNIKENQWETMVRPGKRLKPGDRVTFGKNSELRCEILDYGEGGTRIVNFYFQGNFYEALDKVGHMPLPPYIKRDSDQADMNRYQTVYSKIEGSIAAPTAGLHFTEELLQKIQSKGVKIAYVTLHVGIGTFRPVKVENILDHHMHFEEYEIPQETVDMIHETKAKGKCVISVGTTSTRTLESAADENGRIKAERRATDMFIYPGYKFKVVDKLITNFHLPKSTLLMLVSAFYKREEMLRAYELAVNNRYRFFSYGDAMFIK
ncbi:MAG: tRNA preQ1(34) S-adenosylmethionine ribosyltransferase-isomerase QueA [Peptostreptococcales bacterium]